MSKALEELVAIDTVAMLAFPDSSQQLRRVLGVELEGLVSFTGEDGHGRAFLQIVFNHNPPTHNSAGRYLHRPNSRM